MRKECPGGFRTFSCSRDFGQRIVPPKGGTWPEGTDKSKEKEVTYGGGGSKPNGM